MSYFLAIDTSTERGFVALYEVGKFLHVRKAVDLPQGYQHSKHLFPVIEKLLEEHFLSVAKLDFIAVGIGPGSYTGMRIGAAAAKALAFGADIPLVGLCSLRGFAPEEHRRFITAIDARSGGVYNLVGLKSDDGVFFDDEPTLTSNQNLVELLSTTDLVITPVKKQLQAKIDKLTLNQPIELRERSIDPELFGNQALNLFKEGKVSADGELELLYLRKTQAEIEKEA